MCVFRDSWTTAALTVLVHVCWCSGWIRTIKPNKMGNKKWALSLFICLFFSFDFHLRFSLNLYEVRRYTSNRRASIYITREQIRKENWRWKWVRKWVRKWNSIHTVRSYVGSVGRSEQIIGTDQGNLLTLIQHNNVAKGLETINRRGCSAVHAHMIAHLHDLFLPLSLSMCVLWCAFTRVCVCVFHLKQTKTWFPSVINGLHVFHFIFILYSFPVLVQITHIASKR